MPPRSSLERDVCGNRSEPHRARGRARLGGGDQLAFGRVPHLRPRQLLVRLGAVVRKLTARAAAQRGALCRRAHARVADRLGRRLVHGGGRRRGEQQHLALRKRARRDEAPAEGGARVLEAQPLRARRRLPAAQHLSPDPSLTRACVGRRRRRCLPARERATAGGAAAAAAALGFRPAREPAGREAGQRYQRTGHGAATRHCTREHREPGKHWESFDCARDWAVGRRPVATHRAACQFVWR
mmetsp:Transcript_18441/g.47148  ORF Transcript_18441/g.47148 Transcript_18441/m.47148 type:complete len:241 (+) Transcript_18441:1263-1985(+)